LKRPPEESLDVVERQLPARAERNRVEGVLRPGQLQQDRRRPGGAKLPMERLAEAEEGYADVEVVDRLGTKQAS
jgi:hypothetical protein